MQDDHFTKLYLVLAAIAGSVTALSFRPFQKMSRIEIAVALFVGASFSIFVGPWLIYVAFGNETVDYKLAGAILYITATGSNVLIPRFVKKLTYLMGDQKDQTP